METKNRNYNRVSWFYDWLSLIYSAGKISAVKNSQITELQKGNKVLYVGAGSGNEAAKAGHYGCNIICIDIAPSMIERAKKAFCRNKIKAEFICGDITMHNRLDYYDVITANFFLNIFSEDIVQTLLKHLTKLIKPGGKLLIADFALPQGNRASKISQKIYFRIANRFFSKFGLAPLHPIYDYPKYFNRCGLRLVKTTYFPITKWGPSGYMSITAMRI